MVGLDIFGMQIVVKVKITPLELNPPMDVTSEDQPVEVLWL